MSSGDFNALLLDISKQLSKDQLEDIKFLCNDFIGKKVMEKIDTGLKLFTVLMERGKLGPDDTDFLCRSLGLIHRPDLAAKVQTSSEQSPGENGKERTVKEPGGELRQRVGLGL